MDPKTVALVGATEAEGAVGSILMENLLGSRGVTVYPVNPNHDTVRGLESLPSIASAPDPVDLAVIATPAATVPGVVRECAEAGVHGCVVVSAGFGETGAEGLALENQIREALRGSRIRVIGPNCLGIIRPTVGVNASFLSRRPRRATSP